jgi:hypothetical protein
MAEAESDPPGLARSELVRVLESAARLQEVVPDAVLVGDSAAALWANHRSSFDHDHVLEDLSTRFDAVLEAIEATDGWVTNRVTPGKIILGDLGDIESGGPSAHPEQAAGGHGGVAAVRTPAPGADAR